MSLAALLLAGLLVQAPGAWSAAPPGLGVFFIFFKIIFFTEICFRFHNLQFCTPTTRLRGGRPPAALLLGDRDLNVNKIYF